ncbi:WXG100 family type VII secretion target [Saccharothrix obliqua]|uniref:WXG100 family type VII secretion target n=1 Tax=Saccharothrix obliqua TaxID=2861747 RepID=UPI001C6055A9|nr:hypothetical protein [Saccharothrix obliqua]MBW4719900.1 hypothetical protein [Saccharothrix obliqua]
MAGENPLVAAPPAEPGGFFNAGTGDNGWATGISIAESAMDTFNGIKDGNWVEAGLGMVGLAADAAAMAIDPFGTLLSSAASFLMEHMQPLKDMLDWLAGNPPVIESYSTTWNNVGTELGKVAEDYRAAVASGTAGWEGAAAARYLTNSQVHGDALTGAASAASTVGTVVGLMGMVVAFVREMVRDLIADLVGKLIAWVLEAAFTLGFGTPVIVAQAVTAISKWAAKIAKIIKDLLSTIKKVSPMLKRLVEVFEKIAKVVGKLAGKATGLDVLDPKNIKKGGFLQTGKADVDAPSGSTRGSSSSPDGSSPDGSSPDGSSPDRSSPNGSSPTGSSPTGSSPDGSPPRGPRPGDGTTTTASTPTDTRPGDPGVPGPASTHPGRPHPDGDMPRGLGETRGGPGGAPRTPRPGNPDVAPPGTYPPRGNPNVVPPGGHTPGGNPSGGHMPAGETRGGPGGNTPGGNTPGGNTPVGETRGGPGGNTPPGGYSSPGGSPTPPNRVDHTQTSTAAAPNAPARPDTPHSAGPPPAPGTPGAHQGNPAASYGNSGPGGTPGQQGAPGGNPGGTRPGGGWTGTPGSRGDLGSGVPAPRTPGTPHTSTSNAGPNTPPPGRPHNGPGSGPHPSYAGPPHPGPGHANPVHPGPGHTAPGHTGPGRTPGHTGPGQQHGPQGPVGSRPDNARPRGETGPAGHPYDPAPNGRHHKPDDPHHGPDNGAPHHRSDTDPAHTDPAHTDPAHTDKADTDRPDTDAPHHGPDGERPDIDQAHARHGESTPAGISHHRGDPDMGDLPHRVPHDPRYFTADVHITPDGRARIGNHTYSPEEYGDLLRRNGWDGKTPIRLIGCDAASNDFADRLSRHTGADVLAPTKPAWTDSNGRVYTSDAEVGPDGTRQPRIPPNGEWQTHHPDGTHTRTGDDGFAPGTEPDDKHDLDPTDARDRASDDPAEEHKAPSASERVPEQPHFPDPVDPGPAPDVRDPDFEPDKARGSVVEEIDESRVTRRDGLIETVDGKPVKDYVDELARQRARHHADNLEPDDGPCAAVAIDRRTGLVTEGVNGQPDDLIRPENLHPLLRDNYRGIADWQHPVMKAEEVPFTKPVLGPDGKAIKVTDADGNVVRDHRNQPVLVQEPVVFEGRAHYDEPLRHAEVKAVNELLWERQRRHEEDWRATHGPDSTPPPLDREALRDMRFDPRWTEETRRRDGTVNHEVGGEAPACANCNTVLKDVPSYTGREHFIPYDYRNRSGDHFTPPATE